MKFFKLGVISSLILVILAILVFFGCNQDKRSTALLSDIGEPALEAGVGVADITPPLGFLLNGVTSTGAASRLYAKALVFKQGGVKAAVVGCDLLWIDRSLSRIVRERASKQTGIPFQNISIYATHTHRGPSYWKELKEYLEKIEAGQLNEKSKYGYITTLIDKICKAIEMADKNVDPVEMLSGVGQADSLAFNRRFLMTNGKVRFNPGYLNPRIVRPVGPTDPSVHFLMFRPAGQQGFSASLTVFANHLDTYGGTAFHQDYPFFLQKRLAEIYGGQLVSVFGTGTCGDLNHVDVFRDKKFSMKKMVTEKIGNHLAEAIREALQDVGKSEPSLGVMSNTIYLSMQDFTEKEYEWAEEEVATPLYSERNFQLRLPSYKILQLDKLRKTEAIPPSVSGDPWKLPVEVQVFRLDNQTAIVTLPGEVFVELGLELKKRSPFKNTMVIELANSNIAYVPTLKAYSQGSYETINSRLTPGSGEKMVEEALNLLNQLSE